MSRSTPANPGRKGCCLITVAAFSRSPAVSSHRARSRGHHSLLAIMAGRWVVGTRLSSSGPNYAGVSRSPRETEGPSAPLLAPWSEELGECSTPDGFPDSHASVNDPRRLSLACERLIDPARTDTVADGRALVAVDEHGGRAQSRRRCLRLPTCGYGRCLLPLVSDPPVGRPVPG
jgi:hypothetical protein